LPLSTAHLGAENPVVMPQHVTRRISAEQVRCCCQIEFDLVSRFCGDPEEFPVAVIGESSEWDVGLATSGCVFV